MAIACALNDSALKTIRFVGILSGLFHSPDEDSIVRAHHLILFYSLKDNKLGLLGGKGLADSLKDNNTLEDIEYVLRLLRCLSGSA